MLRVHVDEATSAELSNGLDELVHWVHLKTTNPIESTFATVRLRTKVT